MCVAVVSVDFRLYLCARGIWMLQAPWPKHFRALWFEPEVWRDLKFETCVEPADLADHDTLFWTSG